MMNDLNSTRVQAPDCPAKEVGSSDVTGLKPSGGPAADEIGQSPEPDLRKNQKTTEIPKKFRIIGCRKVLFWEPDRGNRGRGRPRKTFVQQIRDDTGLTSDNEIRELMEDRELWRTDVVARTRKPP